MEQTLTSKLRNEAFSEVVKEKPHYAKMDVREFVGAFWEKFLEAKVHAFPEMCEIARVQNHIKWEELRQKDSRGRFTESYGWSQDGTFKFDFEIPQELYLFMVNLVYKDFWTEGNRRIWRKFMNRVCKGEDPMLLLGWVKSIYGAITPDLVA